jgi:hypothetical protein
MRFGAAVPPTNARFTSARPLLAGDGQRVGIGELHTEHLQHRRDGERVLVDQFPVRCEILGGHA